MTLISAFGVLQITFTHPPPNTVRGKDNALIGVVRVDGKHYKFLGEAARSLKMLAPAGEEEAYALKFTEAKPAANWATASFDDSQWQSGAGMLGSTGTNAGYLIQPTAQITFPPSPSGQRKNRDAPVKSVK